MNKAQKNEVARRLKAIQEDRRITLIDVYNVEANAESNGEDPLVAAEVSRQAYAWNQKWKAEYERMTDEVRAVEQDQYELTGEGCYLLDEGVDAENVLVEGRTEDSVDFWFALVGAAGPAIGARADDYGIDINARLSCPIY